METFIASVDKNVRHLAENPQIREASRLLRQNDIVAFPTETVYGLGANALSAEAAGKIFAAKGRPADNPLIAHIASRKQLDRLVCEIPANAKKLMEAFWPGPLTIIFPANEKVPRETTGGLSTVAVRMPNHPVAKALIEAADTPLAAPSANRSGRPSPTTAAHVKHDLDGRIAGILDGGPTGIGVESTVVDCTGEQVTILRPGGVTKGDLEQVIGPGKVATPKPDASNDEAPKAPGMKYRHYAPIADLYLVEGSFDFIQSIVDKRRNEGFKVGILTTDECKSDYDADVVLSCGSRTDLRTIAHGLYGALRAFDEHKVDEIYGEVFPVDGVGEAIMNRMQKSAGGKVVQGSEKGTGSLSQDSS